MKNYKMIETIKNFFMILWKVIMIYKRIACGKNADFVWNEREKNVETNQFEYHTYNFNTAFAIFKRLIIFSRQFPLEGTLKKLKEIDEKLFGNNMKRYAFVKFHVESQSTSRSTKIIFVRVNHKTEKKKQQKAIIECLEFYWFYETFKALLHSRQVTSFDTEEDTFLLTDFIRKIDDHDLASTEHPFFWKSQRKIKYLKNAFGYFDRNNVPDKTKEELEKLNELDPSIIEESGPPKLFQILPNGYTIEIYKQSDNKIGSQDNDNYDETKAKQIFLGRHGRLIFYNMDEDVFQNKEIKEIFLPGYGKAKVYKNLNEAEEDLENKNLKKNKEFEIFLDKCGDLKVVDEFNEEIKFNKGKEIPLEGYGKLSICKYSKNSEDELIENITEEIIQGLRKKIEKNSKIIFDVLKRELHRNDFDRIIKRQQFKRTVTKKTIKIFLEEMKTRRIEATLRNLKNEMQIKDFKIKKEILKEELSKKMFVKVVNILETKLSYSCFETTYGISLGGYGKVKIDEKSIIIKEIQKDKNEFDKIELVEDFLRYFRNMCSHPKEKKYELRRKWLGVSDKGKVDYKLFWNNITKPWPHLFLHVYTVYEEVKVIEVIKVLK